MPKNEKPEISIDELNERINRDKLANLYKRYWKIGAGIILLIVIGVGISQYYQSILIEKANKGNAELFKAQGLIAENKFDDAIAIFESFHKGSTNGYNMVGYFLTAQVYLEKDMIEKAQEQFILASKDSNVPENYRHIAALYGSMLSLNRGDSVTALTLLNSSLNPKNPFYLLALELAGIANYLQGQYSVAYQSFAKVINSKDVSPIQRARVLELMVMTAGEIKSS